MSENQKVTFFVIDLYTTPSAYDLGVDPIVNGALSSSGRSSWVDPQAYIDMATSDTRDLDEMYLLYERHHHAVAYTLINSFYKLLGSAGGADSPDVRLAFMDIQPDVVDVVTHTGGDALDYRQRASSFVTDCLAELSANYEEIAAYVESDVGLVYVNQSIGRTPLQQVMDVLGYLTEDSSDPEEQKAIFWDIMLAWGGTKDQVVLQQPTQN